MRSSWPDKESRGERNREARPVPLGLACRGLGAAGFDWGKVVCGVWQPVSPGRLADTRSWKGVSLQAVGPAYSPEAPRCLERSLGVRWT